MGRYLCTFPLVLALWAQSASAVLYKFTVETGYQFGCAGVDSCTASPDSGFFTITNVGPSSFTGTVGGSGTANVIGSLSFATSFTGTLGAGASVTLGAGDESSNAGGFNGLDGAKIFITGDITLGGSTDTIGLEVFDKDIHSGVFRTPGVGGAPSDNSCGASAFDNYVLEGGHPTCDTFDDWEVSQPHGHFTFTNITTVPESGTLPLLTATLIILGLRVRAG